MNALSSLNVLPSSPMFGLNSLGGALVVNTRNGRDHGGSRIGLLGGSFGRRALQWETGGVDEVRHSDHFLAANWDRQDGFREHSGSEVRQFFGKVRWHGLGQGVRVEASMALADARLSGTQSLPMDMMADPRSAYTWPDTTRNRAGFVSLKGRRPVGDNQEVAAQLYLRQSQARSLHSNAELDDGCFNDDGTLASLPGQATPQCANKAPQGTATNSVSSASALALGYGRWTSAIHTAVVDSSTRQDTLGSSLQWTHFGQLLERPSVLAWGAAWSQSRISYAQDSFLARLVGYQTLVTPNLNYGFTPNGQPPTVGNRPAFSGSNVLRGVHLASRTQDLSLYVIHTLALTETFKLSASGSFNHSALRQRGQSQRLLNDDGGWTWTTGESLYYNPAFLGAYRASGLGSALVAPQGAVAGPEVSSLDGTHRYRRFNPALSFKHQLGAGHSLFGGYSEAMRAPTSVELSCANPQSPCALPTGFNGDPDLRAVVARTLEFGGRGQWGATTVWSAAVYAARLSDDIQFISAPNSTSFGYFANVGSTERRGLELSAQTRLDKLSLAASLGHVNAVYKTGFTTQAGQEVRSGNTLPGIPRNSLKLRAAYGFSPALHLGVQLIAVSSQVAHGNESNGNPEGKVPGYRLLNLDLNHQINPDIKLTLSVHNLLDKAYSTYGLSQVSSIYTLNPQQFRTPAAPRTVWLGLSYSFGGKAQAQR